VNTVVYRYLLVLVYVLSFSFLASSNELTVVWPDVEQGACMVVVGPDGTAVLVDAGTSHSQIPDQEIVGWLENYKATHAEFRLRYIIATHYHQDHICWIDDIIQAGLLDSDGTVYDRGGGYSSATFTTYLRNVSPYRRTINPGERIELGEGATLQCLVVAGEVYEDGSITTSDENNLSIGLLLSYRSFKLWVGGDLEREVESLAARVIGDVDVYVVHHHGSSTSSSGEFLTVLKPEVAICQVGANPYGHPTPYVIDRLLSTPDSDGDPSNGTPVVILQNAGAYSAGTAAVYIADPDGAGEAPGTITLVTDGDSYTITAPGFSSLRFACGPPGPVETVPSIRVDDVKVIEGGTAMLTVSLSTPSASTITVDYATADGTAVYPDDYTQAAGTLTFAPGETSKQVQVATVEDVIDEPDETFTVCLSNAMNATIARFQGVVTILDDDAIPGPGPGDVIISCVLANAPGRTAKAEIPKEWICLTNVSDRTISLSGCQICDEQACWAIPAYMNAVLRPGQSWRIFGSDYNPGGYTRAISLRNSGETVMLVYRNQVVDSWRYPGGSGDGEVLIRPWYTCPCLSWPEYDRGPH